MLGRTHCVAAWISALALLSGCVTASPQPESQSYSGTLRFWFEGQSFTQDDQNEPWAMGVSENALRQLGDVLPVGFTPPAMGYAIRAQVVGVVAPANPDAHRYGPIGNYAHYITITDVINAQLVPVNCPSVDIVVYFDPGNADLSPSASAQLEDAASGLRRQACNVTDVHVTANTDTVGSASDNLALSSRRAAAVAALIEAQGFRASLIHREGRGEADLPRPTPDNVVDPLNHSARIVFQSSAVPP